MVHERGGVVPGSKTSAPPLVYKEQMGNLEMTPDVALETASVTIGNKKKEIRINRPGERLRMPMSTEREEGTSWRAKRVRKVE